MKLANVVCLLLLVGGVVSLQAADSKAEEATMRAGIDTELHTHTDATTAEKRGITPADYFDFENISDAHISPDGKQVAYVLTTVDQKRNRRENSIWLVAIDGKTAPRRLSAEGVNSTSPRWSPDGLRLAFLSTRGGQAGVSSTGEAAEPSRPQIYVLHLDGGEAQAVTHLKNGAGVFQWSPDGKRFVVLSRTGPSDNVPASARKSDVRHYSHMLYKFNDTGWSDDKRSHLWVVEIGTGAARQLTSGDDWNDSDPQWSPDGTRIAFVSDRTGKEFDEAVNSNKDIWVIPADGGPLTKISDHDYDDTQPRWSPDGQSIAFTGETQRHRFAPKLYLAPASGGKSTEAADNLDLIPTDLHWGPGSRELRFESGCKGTRQIFRIDLGTRKVSPVTSGGAGGSWLRRERRNRHDDLHGQRLSAFGRFICGVARWVGRASVDASEYGVVGRIGDGYGGAIAVQELGRMGHRGVLRKAGGLATREEVSDDSQHPWRAGQPIRRGLEPRVPGLCRAKVGRCFSAIRAARQDMARTSSAGS